MNNFATIAGLAVATVAAAASADVLVSIDLSVVNQVTINATGGLSAVSASGSDTTGIYLNEFYAGAGNALAGSLVSGDFTNAQNPSDGTPSIFRAGGGTDTGLNFWSFSSDTTVTFTAGSLAFVGSATFDISADMYSDMLAGNTSGDLYFPADDASDIAAGAVNLGTWNVVPAPGAMALLGMGGMVATRRRR